MIRTTAMVILYLSQKTKTCSAAKTLVITEDNSEIDITDIKIITENVLEKQPPDVFYKKNVVTCARVCFSIKLQA